MLTLEKIEKRFADQVVLQQVSLTLAEGEVHALLGPSGCGKSTLLRIVMGLEIPEQGSVTFQDHVLVDSANPLKANLFRKLKKHFGYVIQNGGLFPHLTARQNIQLPAESHPNVLTSEACGSRIRELAELTRFPVDGLDRYPSQLSGGQRQRVSLMRALLLNPDLLLLDEPLGALDPLIRAQLQDDLKSIFREINQTVLLVTHDLHEACKLAQQATLLKDGKVEQQGPVSDLIQTPSTPFAKQFVAAQSSLMTSSPE